MDNTTANFLRANARVCQHLKIPAIPGHARDNHYRFSKRVYHRIPSTKKRAFLRALYTRVIEHIRNQLNESAHEADRWLLNKIRDEHRFATISGDLEQMRKFFEKQRTVPSV